MRLALKVAIAVVVLLIGLLVGLSMALPRIASSEAVRARLEALGHDATGQKVQWEELGFGLLPPRLIVTKPQVVPPDGSEDPLSGAACDGADSDLCMEGILECAAGSLSCTDTTGDNPICSASVPSLSKTGIGLLMILLVGTTYLMVHWGGPEPRRR